MLTNTEILRDRYDAKKKQIETRIAELKATARSEAASEVESLRAKLDDMRAAVTDGWSNLTEETAAMINRLIQDDNDRPMAN